MKTKESAVCILLFLCCNCIFAQDNSTPATGLVSLDGTVVTTDKISNDGKPLVMIFWKSNDIESCEQLLLINEAYQNIMQFQGVKVIAICIDCIGTTQHIKPFVYGHNLEIEVYVDQNGDFKRSMNILQSPSTILFDHQMNINCQYAGYCSNVEDLLCSKIEQCLANIN